MQDSEARAQRRKYVRVQDVVRLSFEVIEQDALEEAKRQIAYMRAHDADFYPRRFSVSRSSDGDTDAALRQIGDAIARLDQKLDYVLFMVDRLLDTEDRMKFSHPMHCDISGGGMMFAAVDKPGPGALMRMSVLLGRYNVSRPIHLIARVVRSTLAAPADPTHPYRVAVHFLDIAEDDREAIIAHVIAVQRAELRARRGKEA
ncbi:PilZ domain-containing protein [bacterium]|nr:PilZ domain-containing protein [bacterium]